MGKTEVPRLKIIIMTLLCITITSIQQRRNLTAEISDTKFSLKTTSTWQAFDDFLIPANKQKEKRALTVQITFRSKKALRLQEVALQWVGDPIENLTASLYKKREYDSLKLIEKNMVSDGIWDSINQQIIFNMDEKLVAINKYYLILNFTKKIESKLKKGKFILSEKKPIRISALR